MNIAWCTPFTPESAIGRVSALVVDELRTTVGWDVAIYYPEGAGGRSWPDRGQPLDPESAGLLRSHDLVIYNIGDQARYHGLFLQLARHVPGVAILHDVASHHLVLGALTRRPRWEIVRDLAPWYGPDRAARLADAITTGDFAWIKAANFSEEWAPLTEYALESMNGVLTHSQYAADIVRERYVGDVAVLPLPVQRQVSPAGPRGRVHVLDQRHVILQVGVLNPYKLVPLVIEAFALAEIDHLAQLVICGAPDTVEIVAAREMIATHGLGASVHIWGEISDGELHALRERAMGATVLRDPVPEGASAALLENMAYGLATITTSGGHYGELPRDVTARVSAHPSASEVAAVLSTWVNDPGAPRALGERARQYVETVHTPRAYAQQLEGILPSIGGYRRREALFRQLASTLEATGFTPADPIFHTVAAAATELFADWPRYADQQIFTR